MCRGAGPMAATAGMGGMWCSSAMRRSATWRRCGAASTSGPGGGGTGKGRTGMGRGGRSWLIPVPAGTQARRWTAAASTWSRPGSGPSSPTAGAAGTGTSASRLHAAGAALRREGDRGRGGLDRAAAEAAGRRRAGRPAERRQVLAAGAADPGRPEGRRLPVHDALAGAGDDRGRGPPGGAGRHPRPDRGRRRRRRARARVPRPRRALRDARPPGRPGAAGGRSRWPTTRRCGRSWPPTAAGLERLPELVVLSKRDLLAPERVEEALAEWRRTAGRSGRGRARRLLGDRRGAGGAAAQDPRRAARGGAVAGRGPRRRCRLSSRSSTASTGRPARAATRSSARTTAASASLGRGVELLFERHDLSNEEALAYLEQRLNEIGVVAALRAAGFEPGDDVRVGEHEFELHP